MGRIQRAYRDRNAIIYWRGKETVLTRNDGKAMKLLESTMVILNVANFKFLQN